MGRVSVKLERQTADYHFKAINSLGHSIDIDDATAYEDGKGNGVGPMQLLVMAIGGCSAVDIVSILNKARQKITSFNIQVDGDKPDGVSPSVFTSITVHYALSGDMTESRVRRAIDLSLGKYCSVARMLEKTASIHFGFSINGEEFTGGTV